jgi:predicted ABC-type exoprotein transport system permease subunit
MNEQEEKQEMKLSLTRQAFNSMLYFLLGWFSLMLILTPLLSNASPLDKAVIILGFYLIMFILPFPFIILLNQPRNKGEAIAEALIIFTPLTVLCYGTIIILIDVLINGLPL